jgi:hypothetical protein
MATLIDDNENEHRQIDPPDPIEAINPDGAAGSYPQAS